MKKLYLDKNWIMYNQKTGKVDATVPGCVHTDLINCGQIQDIYWRDNFEKYQWIEDENFTYSCVFDAEVSDKDTSLL